MRATCCECSRSEPQRRASPATAARRSARGSSDQSSGSWMLTASSTMPSRSDQSLVTISSTSNTSKIVARSVTPAGISSARFSSTPGRRRRSATGIFDDAAVPRLQPVGRDAQAVGARGHLAVLPTATRRARSLMVPLDPDRHARQLGGERRRRSAPVRRGCGSSSASRSARVGGSVVDQLAGQAADAELHARAPAQSRGVADRELDAAAADVDAQGGRRFEHDAGAHGGEDQAGLLASADHLDLDAGLGLDAVDELAAVRRGADRARRLRDHLLRAVGVGELVAAGGRSRRRAPPRRSEMRPSRATSSPRRSISFSRVIGFERAVGMHVGDQEVEGVDPRSSAAMRISVSRLASAGSRT